MLWWTSFPKTLKTTVCLTPDPAFFHHHCLVSHHLPHLLLASLRRRLLPCCSSSQKSDRNWTCLHLNHLPNLSSCWSPRWASWALPSLLLTLAMPDQTLLFVNNTRWICLFFYALIPEKDQISISTIRMTFTTNCWHPSFIFTSSLIPCSGKYHPEKLSWIWLGAFTF